MERSIGLWGAVVTLVGFVIGAGIFLLPGELAATAGPGVVISYGIASVVVMFSCIIAAHIGATLPTSGASFIYATRMTAPICGFLMVWLTIVGVSMSVALVAHGFAEYFDILVPDTNKTLVAVAIVLAFGGINLAGARASVRAQTLMVILFMAVVIAFAVVGVARVDADLLVPVAPNGYAPVLMAAVPAFFSYAGFFMIIDIGGEIRNPSRTIPLALLISFLVVWLCYSGVALAIVGHIPWRELADDKASVATVAGMIFPGWTKDIVTCTVLAAAATSLNGLLLGYSRDVYVLSRVRILPEVLSRLSGKHREPLYSVALLTGTSVVGVLIGARISEYATIIVIALMLAQVLLGVATLRLPKVMPGRPGQAAFELSPFWRTFFAVGLIATSTVFIVIGVAGSPGSALLLVLLMLAGAVYYSLRKGFLESRGIHLEEEVMEHVEARVSGRDP